MTPRMLVLFLLHDLLLDLDSRLEVLDDLHRVRLTPPRLLQSPRVFEDLHFLLQHSQCQGLSEACASTNAGKVKREAAVEEETGLA